MPFRPLIAPAMAVLVLGSWAAAFGETLVLDTGKSAKSFDFSNANGSASFGTTEGNAVHSRSSGEQARIHHGANSVKLTATVSKGKVKVNYVKELNSLKHDDFPIIVMQADGNLCVYSDQPRHKGLIWQSGTKGQGCRLILQDDGFLTIRDGKDKFLWHAAKPGPGSRL